MGCVFCATGQMGFVRHLQPGEIVGQVLQIVRDLRSQGERLRNIVLMGMGEPLHNYAATMTAIDILTDHHGLSIGPRYITLSTVGIPPAIRRIADEGRSFNLAVSLHAATNDERSRLVPTARKWPLIDLIDACRYYINKLDRRVFFEWALISGKNDTPEQAKALGKLLQNMNAHVNLIPLNDTIGYDGNPSDRDAIGRFQAILAEYGLPSTIRQRRGLDINAGCGTAANQLRCRSRSTKNDICPRMNPFFAVGINLFRIYCARLLWDRRPSQRIHPVTLRFDLQEKRTCLRGCLPGKICQA